VHDNFCGQDVGIEGNRASLTTQLGRRAEDACGLGRIAAEIDDANLDLRVGGGGSPVRCAASEAYSHRHSTRSTPLSIATRLQTSRGTAEDCRACWECFKRTKARYVKRFMRFSVACLIQDPEDNEYGGSPPCFLHEIGPDGAPVDAQQARDVARWRKVERLRLIALRCALPAENRALLTAAIARKLDEMISVRSNEIVSAYWPIRAEPDLRSWMREACGGFHTPPRAAKSRRLQCSLRWSASIQHPTGLATAGASLTGLWPRWSAGPWS
jgi:hypothetical protein